MEDIETLIIEDDNRIAKIHSMFLQKIPGFRVAAVASTLEDAAFMIKEIKPALILLDLYFPDGNGLNLLYKLRADFSDVDVIVITAANDTASINRAIKGGVADYIIKPVIFERFAEAMERYKDKRSLLNQHTELDQEGTDALLMSGAEIRQTPKEEMPKGIEPITLAQVLAVFKDCPAEGLSAQEAGTAAGLSRTTARKYLEYLYSVNVLNIKLEYGTIGRPERRYVKKS